MDYHNLGRTGVAVSPLCFGAMMMGEWGNPDHQACHCIIRAAVDDSLWRHHRITTMGLDESVVYHTRCLSILHTTERSEARWFHHSPSITGSRFLR